MNNANEQLTCPYCGGTCPEIDIDDGSELECNACDGWLDQIDNFENLVGRDCVINGQWMMIESSYPNGDITAIDQDGGDHQVNVGMVDHWY